jgi:predicted phage baseplate assembly protein
MLPAPTLDDRRFQDLVDDAKRLVARRCPEWTDHNVSDPGVTLIETFAFMTDALLYRLNRVPDRLYVKFLDMIGLRMLPATAARVPVTFWLAAPPDAPFTIATSTAVATIGTEQVEPAIFSTGQDLEILPCSLAALATGSGSEEVVDRTHDLELGSPVAVFSTPPALGDSVYLGLDGAVPSCAVRIDAVARAEGVGVNPKRPPLVVEADCDGGWVECEVTDDGTGGFNRSGSLVVHVPADHRMGIQGGQAAGWLRARVTAPEPGQPPYSDSPVLRALSACTVGGTVTAVHAEIVDEETVGTSEGVPGQRFGVDQRPVLAGVGEPVVEVSSFDGWQPWERVEHFAASGEQDHHYVLDAYAGELAFGPMVRLPDGGTRQHGAVPAAGETIRVRGYAVGGGPLGNVGPHSISALRTSLPFVTEVDNRTAATGGTEGETLAEAMERGPLMLRTRDRAVTTEDYEVLAREAAPELARVRCVPADGNAVPAGSVKLLVVPAAPAERGRVALDTLIPAEEMLERIGERLKRARVAGVRVLLEPPRYRGVTVVATLVARPRVKVSTVEDEALERLYRLVSPLPGGGPDGHGWPFGRPVQSGELFAALRDVRGVELVEDLRLFGADPVTGRRGAEVQRLDLDPDSLVFSFEHQVRVEAS